MIDRRAFLATALAAALASRAFPAAPPQRPRPLILDTDIGDDIDDTWALLMLLRMPELQLKLAVGDFGNPTYRARLLAKLLELTGFAQVPVGLGVTLPGDPRDGEGLQSRWLQGYRLEDYPGAVREDGVQAIIDTISSSPEPVDLLCLGPVPNIAEALRRAPSIAANARFVGMFGSLRRGYGDSPEPTAEYNVRVSPDSLQAVFAAPWECAIAPLDSCGVVQLGGARYQRIHASDDPWMTALMENYRAWLPGAPFIPTDHDPNRVSTTLFDTVAVHLAAGGALLELETLPLRVLDSGHTVIDRAQGRPVTCATGWRDLETFKDQLTETLLGRSRGPSVSLFHRGEAPP